LIQVKLHSVFKNYCPDSGEIMQFRYEDGLTAKKILENLEIKPGIVGLTIVNGKVTPGDCVLTRGDIVEFYPIFGGG